MAKYELISEPPLAGTNLSIGDVRLSSEEKLSIVSLALPLGQEEEAGNALRKAYKVALPESGQSVVSPDGSRLVRTGQDQVLLLIPEVQQRPEAAVSEALKGTVYTTDQSDVWVALKLEGSNSLAALERVCPIDLHESVFPTDYAARTVMEHLGVLVIRTGDMSFTLLSASSSAESFLHIIETSAKNVT